eukprot:6213967-Pleurochrysis_carterae.AAC.3
MTSACACSAARAAYEANLASTAHDAPGARDVRVCTGECTVARVSARRAGVRMSRGRARSAFVELRTRPPFPARETRVAPAVDGGRAPSRHARRADPRSVALLAQAYQRDCHREIADEAQQHHHGKAKCVNGGGGGADGGGLAQVAPQHERRLEVARQPRGEQRAHKEVHLAPCNGRRRERRRAREQPDQVMRRDERPRAAVEKAPRRDASRG